VGSDVRGFLAREGGDRFDVVLVDPPYAAPADEVEAVLRRLEAAWLAAPDWTVVLTRPGRGRADDPALPDGWRVARRLTYGDTLVLVCRGVGNGPIPA
jgi:16S rRNA (guanine966-N2)-methyltransferase